MNLHNRSHPCSQVLHADSFSVDLFDHDEVVDFAPPADLKMPQCNGLGLQFSLSLPEFRYLVEGVVPCVLPPPLWTALSILSYAMRLFFSP